MISRPPRRGNRRASPGFRTTRTTDHLWSASFLTVSPTFSSLNRFTSGPTRSRCPRAPDSSFNGDQLRPSRRLPGWLPVALTDFVFVIGAWGEAAAVTARHSATAITVAAVRMRSSLARLRADSARTCHFIDYAGTRGQAWSGKTTTYAGGEWRRELAGNRFGFCSAVDAT